MLNVSVWSFVGRGGRMNSHCPKHDCELQRGGRQVSANENESRLTDAGTQQEGRRRREMQVCPACYAPKRFCRSCATTHCQCAWAKCRSRKAFREELNQGGYQHS